MRASTQVEMEAKSIKEKLLDIFGGPTCPKTEGKCEMNCELGGRCRLIQDPMKKG